MKLEADRLANLDLSDSHVGPERDVVLEERRMRVDNQPQSLMNEQMQAALHLSHPYGRPVIGWAEEVRRIDRVLGPGFLRSSLRAQQRHPGDRRRCHARRSAQDGAGRLWQGAGAGTRGPGGVRRAAAPCRNPHGDHPSRRARCRCSTASIACRPTRKACRARRKDLRPSPSFWAAIRRRRSIAYWWSRRNSPPMPAQIMTAMCAMPANSRSMPCRARVSVWKRWKRR